VTAAGCGAHLADGGVAREAIRIFTHALLARQPRADLEHRPPLGKARPGPVVLGAPRAEAVKTLQIWCGQVVMQAGAVLDVGMHWACVQLITISRAGGKTKSF